MRDKLECGLDSARRGGDNTFALGEVGLGHVGRRPGLARDGYKTQRSGRGGRGEDGACRIYTRRNAGVNDRT